MQIALPELENNYPEMWDIENEVLMVAVRPYSKLTEEIVEVLAIDQFREVEPWIDGKVELKIIMVYTTDTEGGSFVTTYSNKRNVFRSCGLFSCWPIWVTINRTLTEFETEYGDRIIVSMFEEDWNFLGTTTYPISFRSTIDGQLILQTVDVIVNLDHTNLGEVEVNYCDTADYPGTLYDNNFLRFYWGHE